MAQVTCNPTSDCNLICNREMYDNDGVDDCPDKTGVFTFPPPCNYNGWAYIGGSPDYYIDLNSPVISSGLVGLVCSYMDNFNFQHTEVLYTEVPILQNNKYLLSYIRKSTSEHTYLSDGIPLIASYDDAVKDFNIVGFDLQDLPDPILPNVYNVSNLPLSTTDFIIYEDDKFSNNGMDDYGWKQIITCFEVPGDFDGVYMYPKSKTYEEGISSYLYLDQFEIIEDIFIEDETIVFDPDTQTELELGADLCKDVTNMIYKWDMFDCSTWEWVSLPEFDNQPLISLTEQDNNLPQVSTQYRLTRTFEKLIDNGVDYDIVIDNNNGCPVEKSAIFTILVGDDTEFINCCYFKENVKYDLTFSEPPYVLDDSNNEFTWTASDNPFDNNTPPKIDNDIIIKENTKLYLDNITMEFGLNGRIIVEPGGWLFLKNGTVLTGDLACETMWQGIRVLGGASPTNRGEVIMSDSYIEYAIIGIANHQLNVFNFNNSPCRKLVFANPKVRHYLK